MAKSTNPLRRLDSSPKAILRSSSFKSENLSSQRPLRVVLSRWVQANKRTLANHSAGLDGLFHPQASQIPQEGREGLSARLIAATLPEGTPAPPQRPIFHGLIYFDLF